MSIKDLSGLDYERIGRTVIQTLDRYGFVLTKSDWESLFIHLLDGNPIYQQMNSYERADFLRVTDSKYRGLRRRSAMWLEKPHKNDQQLLSKFLKDIITKMAEQLSDEELHFLVDDELDRRNLQKMLEKRTLPVDISLSGRNLVLKASDLSTMLKLIQDELPNELRSMLGKKEGQEKLDMFYKWAKTDGVHLLTDIAKKITFAILPL